MSMIYTLCWQSREWEIDIKVNREQRIGDTMLILLDGGILPMRVQKEKEHIFSKRKNQYIDMDFSYEEAEIYNGDILYIIEKE